jgi:hypothetical protein
MAFATGQAQPKQQSQGTPYNPQQGNNFSAWTPQVRNFGASQQQQSQMATAWAQPKQNLLQWGQSLPQFQQHQPQGGMDPQQLWARNSALVQQVNDAGAQQQVGTFLGQGAPPPNWGNLNLNPQQMLNNANQMTQGGWQNPFMQPGFGGPGQGFPPSMNQQPSFGGGQQSGFGQGSPGSPPGYGDRVNNPGGFFTGDLRDSDRDGIDDRDQMGPGMPGRPYGDPGRQFRDIWRDDGHMYNPTRPTPGSGGMYGGGQQDDGRMYTPPNPTPGSGGMYGGGGHLDANGKPIPPGTPWDRNDLGPDAGATFGGRPAPRPDFSSHPLWQPPQDQRQLDSNQYGTAVGAARDNVMWQDRFDRGATGLPSWYGRDGFDERAWEQERQKLLSNIHKQTNDRQRQVAQEALQRHTDGKARMRAEANYKANPTPTNSRARNASIEAVRYGTPEQRALASQRMQPQQIYSPNQFMSGGAMNLQQARESWRGLSPAQQSAALRQMSPAEAQAMGLIGRR